jgi:hypothetical protein
VPTDRRTLSSLLTAVIVIGAVVVGAVPGGISARASSVTDARVEAAKSARRLIIAIDLSKSNPLIRDSAFATKAGLRIAHMIETMGFASEVHVRTFGEYGSSANDFYYDAVLSIRQRPADVAAEVSRLIANTPALVKRGAWKAQNTTNILAFLDNAAHSFGCAGMPTDVVLATDGIEDSEYTRLIHANAHLPKPEGAPFKGCAELLILGLAQGQNSPQMTERLRTEWQRWAIAAGFATFVGLNDW